MDEKGFPGIEVVSPPSLRDSVLGSHIEYKHDVVEVHHVNSGIEVVISNREKKLVPPPRLNWMMLAHGYAFVKGVEYEPLRKDRARYHYVPITEGYKK